MKTKGCQDFTWHMRLKLEALLKAEVHKEEIAKVLGKCLKSVYNEIHRGECQILDGRTWLYKTVYSPAIAQEKAEYNKTSKGAPLKVGNDYDFVHYVEDKVIKEKISPCAVLGEMKRKNLPFKTQISKTTLYRYIDIGIFSRIEMKPRKRKYDKPTAKRAPRGTSIEQRDKEVLKRNTFGHWEMDCVVGETLTTLLCLTERKTRYELIVQMPNRQAKSVVHCLNAIEHKFGKAFSQIFKSITVDNGAEFSDVKGLETSKFSTKKQRLKVYYCHPYTSCERGSNERINRDIRKWIPKGENIAIWKPYEIMAIQDHINNYPRQIFDYATPREMFEAEIAAIQASMPETIINFA